MAVSDAADAGLLDPDDPLLKRVEAILRALAKKSGTISLEDIGLEVEFAETPELTAWLEAKRIQFADKALNRYIEDVRQALDEGVDAGETPQELAERVQEVFDGRKANALTVARTETTGTANVARQESYLSADLKDNLWAISQDDQVRESHQAIDGEKRKIGSKFSNGLRFPGDTDSGDVAEFANCILPGTLVSGAVVGGLKALYAGPAREIQTRRGYRLAVTAKHPILTTRGWVPADDLSEADVLVSARPDVERGAGAVLINDECEQAPALIEDVFKALLAQRSSARVPNANLDLHGDEIALIGEVEIVGSARQFVDDGKSTLCQGGAELRCSEADVPLVLVGPSGPQQLLGVRYGSPTAGSPGRRELAHYGGTIALQDAPLQTLRLGAAAHCNTSLGEASKQSRSRTSEFLRELLQACSGLVALDDIEEIRDFNFSGHVYDLQATDGWIIAGGIVVSNCRCAVVAVIPGAKAYRRAWLVRALKRFEAARRQAERQLKRQFVACVNEQQRRVLAALPGA